MPTLDRSSASTTTPAPGACRSDSTSIERTGSPRMGRPERRMIVPVERRVEVGELLPAEGPLSVAASIYMPPRLRTPPTALFCLPGGALTRRYYDLQPNHATTDDFSFAVSLAARGFIVVTLDLLGVGGSSRPRDGFELTPDVLTTANTVAVDRICSDLLAGVLAD